MENSSHLPQKQSPLSFDAAMEYEMKDDRLFNDPNIDWKKIRRSVSNRLSAQRSRIKTANHTRDMEKMVKDLEELISVLKPQVESYNEKNNLLQLENDSLRQELEKRSNESRRLELAIEEKRAEIKMLKELAKTAQNNKIASDHSEAKEIPDLRSEPFKVAQYPSIDLYRICLQNQQKNPSPVVPLKMLPDSAIEQSGKEIKPSNEVEKTNLQEYEDIDQYINLDALNASDVGN